MIRLPRRNPEINADYSPRRRLSAGGLRLNFSDSQRALSDLNRAVGQGPRYVEEDVSSGVKAVAKGAQQATNALQELQIRNQYITDKRKLFDNETKLAVSGEELQGKLTLENDPNKWESIAAEHMASVEFDTEGMSPSAVEALQQYSERTRALTVARARNGGFAENERRMVGSALASLDIHTRARNLRGIAETTKALVDGGHWTPEQGMNVAQDHARQVQTAEIRDLGTQVENLALGGKYDEAKQLIETHHFINDPLLAADKQNMLLKVDAKKEEVEFGNAIAANPRAELEELKKPDGKYADKPEWQRQDMIFKASQMVENKSAVNAKRAIDGIIGKTITKPEQLDGPEFKDITPVQKETLKKTLLEGAPNDDKEWMGLAAEINNFEPSDNPDQDALRLAHIENMVEVRFKGSYKDQLVRMIAERREGETESDVVAKQKLTNYLTEGFLGNYKVPYVPAKDNWFSEDTAGTPLSPADQALTDTAVPEGQRITKGKPVVDVQREALARAKWAAGLNGLRIMKRKGATSKEMEDWVDSYAQQYSVSAALQNKEKEMTPIQQQPLFNSLPNVNKFMLNRPLPKSWQGKLPPEEGVKDESELKKVKAQPSMDGVMPTSPAPGLAQPNPMLPVIEQ